MRDANSPISASLDGDGRRSITIDKATPVPCGGTHVAENRGDRSDRPADRKIKIESWSGSRRLATLNREIRSMAPSFRYSPSRTTAVLRADCLLMGRICWDIRRSPDSDLRFQHPEI